MQAINYGGHNVPPPLPADGGANSGNTVAGGGQGQGGGGNWDPEKNQRVAERARVTSPAIPYGYIGDEFSPQQMDRIRQFPDWDGDMRWPPEQFLAGERNRAARLRAMDRQQQEIAWQQGRTQMAQLRRDEMEARMWNQRGNEQGYQPNQLPRLPYGRR